MRHSIAIAAAIAVMVLLAHRAHAQNSIGAADDAQCQSYGAQPGTNAYVNCRLQLQQQHLNMIQNLYHPISPPPAPVPVVPMYAPPRPQNCITNYVGAYAYTNCN